MRPTTLPTKPYRHRLHAPPPFITARKMILICHPMEGWKAESTWAAGYIPEWFICPQSYSYEYMTHSGTNWPSIEYPVNLLIETSTFNHYTKPWPHTCIFPLCNNNNIAQQYNNHLLYYYTSVIRPVLEYCVPVWHYALTKDQSQQIERIQKRAIHIIFSFTCGMPYRSKIHVVCCKHRNSCPVSYTHLTLPTILRV